MSDNQNFDDEMYLAKQTAIEFFHTLRCKGFKLHQIGFVAAVFFSVVACMLDEDQSCRLKKITKKIEKKYREGDIYND